MIGTAEMASYTLKDETAFIVLATDGVWEFMTSQAVVDLVRTCVRLHLAAQRCDARLSVGPGAEARLAQDA